VDGRGELAEEARQVGDDEKVFGVASVQADERVPGSDDREVDESPQPILICRRCFKSFTAIRYAPITMAGMTAFTGPMSSVPSPLAAYMRR
jgi:hypothetical protein